MASRVMVTVEEGIACVRLARPEKMNALDADMFDGLRAAGERLRDEPGVRAVVLHGEGRAFCAGLDMASFEQMQSGGGLAQVGATSGLTVRTHGAANAPQHAVMVWRQVPVPVIAAVHGVAFGGGLQLALAADLRFVAPDTRLSVMEIKWGLVPDMGGMVLMRELARADVVRDLVLSGRVFSGEEAQALGFATRVTADPLEDAMRYAREIRGRSPSAIRAAKRLFDAAARLDEAALLLAESVEQEALIGGADQIEAVRANLERREPRFASS